MKTRKEIRKQYYMYLSYYFKCMRECDFKKLTMPIQKFMPLLGYSIETIAKTLPGCVVHNGTNKL